MRGARLGGAVGLLAALAACGGTSTPVAEIARPTTTAAALRVRPTNPDPAALGLGATFTTREGNTVRVIAYDQPVRAKVLEPEVGMEFAAVEAEICAGRRGAPRVSPDRFVLEMPDGTRRARSYLGPKEPVLQDTQLSGEACIRGWMNFEVPQRQRPSHVVFQGSSLGRWALTRR